MTPHAEAMLSQLRDLIRKNAVLTGYFKLSSGEISNHYIDLSRVAANSTGARLIGGIIYEMTKGIDFHAIGGPSTGSIPIVTATSAAFGDRGIPLEGFWIADKPKRYGTQDRLDGRLEGDGMASSNVVVVDDVATTGNSLVKTIKFLQRRHKTVCLVIVIVDRLRGAKDKVLGMGVPEYRALFTERELI